MSKRNRRRRSQKAGIGKSRQPSNVLDHAFSYTLASQLFDESFTVSGFLSRVASFSWRESLLGISYLSALVVRHGVASEVVRKATVDRLLLLDGPSDGLDRMRARVSANRDNLAIAHEEGLSFLAHLALMLGGETTEGPSLQDLSLWLLAANEFLEFWSEPDSRELSTNEQLIAELARVMRFNHDPDRAASLALIYRIVGQGPDRGPLADESRWKQLQNEAFGCSWEQYFESFLAPLILLSTLWGTTDGPESFPVVSKSQIASQTRLDTNWFEKQLSTFTGTRDSLATLIQNRLRPDGLPHAPTALYHRPLVSIDEDRLVAPLPWALDQQIHSGVWMQFLLAAKRIYGDAEGAQIWMSTFGDLFENWCRHVAATAAKEPKFRGRLVLPTHPGAADEIEDVVVIDGSKAILFSVKSRFVKEPIARHALSRSGFVDWYEEFLFGSATTNHRAGALRLLSKRIDAIRAGEFESVIARDCRIFPVLVTYDTFCGIRSANRVADGGDASA